jgi:hypothetical protein
MELSVLLQDTSFCRWSNIQVPGSRSFEPAKAGVLSQLLKLMLIVIQTEFGTRFLALKFPLLKNYLTILLVFVANGKSDQDSCI